jgi:hypothetical protein
VVTLTATRQDNSTTVKTFNVTVNDVENPVISCPANINTNTDANSCTANVNPGAATATDNCSVASVVGVRSDAQPLNAAYPKGTTTIVWTATDASGRTSSCTQTVTVNDAQAPTLSLLSVATASFWPPNHNLLNVGLSGGNLNDNCPGSTRQVFIYGDEDDDTETGDGNHSPDAANIGIGTLRLRSERNGMGDGRVYLIVVKATDAAGNSSASCQTVTVPHSNSSSSKASVAAQAASAKAFCQANNGAAPAGYFVVGDGPVIGSKQ